MATTAAPTAVGKIVQVIGPVIDVAFENDHLPELYNAVTVTASTFASTTIDAASLTATTIPFATASDSATSLTTTTVSAA